MNVDLNPYLPAIVTITSLIIGGIVGFLIGLYYGIILAKDEPKDKLNVDGKSK